jgi:8-oxo-dGTP diphosphatase
MDHKPLIPVSAAALINSQGQVLYTQRPKGKSMEGLWEFPGGKIEPGETAEKALQREMMEELSVHIEIEDLIPLTFASQEYDKFIMLMPLFICNKWTGEIHPNEGQEYDWVDIDNLYDYPMPEADLPLLKPIIQFLKAGILNFNR